MSNLKAALSSMKDNFANSQAAYEQFFEKIPAGTYDALLLKCFLKLNEESGNIRLTRVWLILSGEREGKQVFDGINVGGEYGPAFVRRFIEQCEYVFNPDDPEELEDTCAAIQEEQLCFSIKVVHKDDFVNVNVQKQIANPNGDAAPAADDADGEAAPEAPADDAENLDDVTAALFAFCSAQGLEGLTDGDDLDTLKGIMMGYTFNPEELDETEIELINQVGMGDRLVVPEPEPPKVVKAAPAKAPAKAAPAPAPAKAAPAKAAPAPAKAAPAKAPAKAAPAAPAKKGPQKAK